MSDFIEILGAETHNLKNISVKIPKNKLVVVTGLSGSGKSSLAFETLYAEGQKRYLESLSTFARMMINNTSDATKVQEIRGLSPTIAINQKTVSNNPRSTVGTITEIYDFYRLLFKNIGKPHCPNHPEQSLLKDTVIHIVDFVKGITEGEKIFITFPLLSYVEDLSKLSKKQISEIVSENGFVRYLIKNDVFSVADMSLKGDEEKKYNIEDIEVIVDRLITKKDDAIFDMRVGESLILCSEKSGGIVNIYFPQKFQKKMFSLEDFCPICGYKSSTLTLSNFSFNSHYGACEDCGGLGFKNSIEEENIINENLSLAEGAILPWTSPYYFMLLEAVCKKKKIPYNKPFKKLTDRQREQILYGVDGEFEIEDSFFDKNNKTLRKVKFEGVINNIERRFANIQGLEDKNIKRLERFITEKPCRTCQGFRLKKPFLMVFIEGKNIGEVASMSVEDSLKFFKNLSLTESEKIISQEILKNIVERLEFLEGVGLGYITLARRANTLSGGESQRIRLATQIGTKLEGIIYVLDEPSIGLHPRDNNMLIQNLKKLSEMGNTVVVVEHDEDIMRESDYIIDIGPGAGVNGGEVIFSGKYEELLKYSSTETSLYLSRKKTIVRQNYKKTSTKKYLSIFGASEHNLKNINVRFPLGCMTVVTGVSGSGKSSLVMDILANALLNHFNKSNLPVGKHKKIEGFEYVDKTIIIDQSPIGRTPHSNVATYTGVFTYIREVFAASRDAKVRGFNAGKFSFNTRGGRCEVCEGSGTKKVEMHFLPDVYVECESCKGTRYSDDVLSVHFKGKNIADVLNMTIEEASIFFVAFPRIKRILDILCEVGLGYITLGQSAPTLSGGESQRIKLAFDLSKRSTGNTVYILDEPTTGLHFADVQKLLDVLDQLVEKGNSVIIIEHNMDIIANADAIIDIGPEGGDAGGNLIFAGPREKIIEVQESYTGQALRKYRK